MQWPDTLVNCSSGQPKVPPRCGVSGSPACKPMPKGCTGMTKVAPWSESELPAFCCLLIVIRKSKNACLCVVSATVPYHNLCLDGRIRLSRATSPDGQHSSVTVEFANQSKTATAIDALIHSHVCRLLTQDLGPISRCQCSSLSTLVGTRSQLTLHPWFWPTARLRLCTVVSTPPVLMPSESLSQRTGQTVRSSGFPKTSQSSPIIVKSKCIASNYLSRP